MPDPFDVSNSDIPAADPTQTSPDFWRNLAAFGSQMAVAANARTPQGFLQYGPGLAGPFGAGVMGAMSNDMDIARQRANLGLVGAETQSRQIANQMAAYGLPIARARARAISDPNFMNQLMGGGGTGEATPGVPSMPQTGPTPGTQSQAGPNLASTGSNIASITSQAESGNNPSAVNAQGYSGKYQMGKSALMAAGVYTPAPGEDPKAQGPGEWWGTFNIPGRPQPMTYNQFLGDPGAQDAAFLAHVTNLNREIQSRGLRSYIGQNVGGVPITQDSLIEMMQGGGPAGTQRFLESNGKYNPADANGQTIADFGRRVSAATPPVQVAQTGAAPQITQSSSALQAQSGGAAPHAPQSIGAAPQIATGSVPQGAAPQAPAPQGQATPTPHAMSPGYVSPQQAFQMAAQARDQANRMAFLGLGDPSIAKQYADQMQDYGQRQLLQQTAIQSIRGPGGGSVNPATGEIVQSPLEYNLLGPDRREWRITQNAIEDPSKPYVRPPGVPDWAPPGTLSAAPSKLAPGEEEAEKEAGMDAFGEKARAQYASAAGTLRSMEDIDQQLNVLNANGPSWYNTGSGAQFKQQFGRAVNSMAASVGAPPIFDPDKLAAGEDIIKQAKLAGMQTLSTFFGGSREAASIVHSTQSAVPNLENTPVGAKLVLSGIKEGARWLMDEHTFMANWYLEHKSNVGADVAFTQQYPPQMYTRRAISQVRPYEIPGDSPEEMKRFLPGTRLTVKADPTHQIKIVPGPESLPLSQGFTQPQAAAPSQ